jgi:hypothetical protein
MEADPTPDEIEQRAAEIRSRWNRAEHDRRLAGITGDRSRQRVSASIEKAAAVYLSLRLQRGRNE